jgi:hypothetical protein
MLTLAGQLVQIWLDDEREFMALRTLRKRMDRAWKYLNRPGCNEPLGLAHLDRTGRAYSEHRHRLRANRRQAWALVSRLNALLAAPAGGDSRGGFFPAVELGSPGPTARYGDGW